MSTSAPAVHPAPAEASQPPGPDGFPFEAFRRGRFGERPACARCGASRVVRWGGFSGRRRYRCRSCRRTFSDFTATPLAYLKHVDRWPAHASCVLASRSVRSTARQIGVHRTTAFRWRHRLLDALRGTDLTPLQGSVSLAVTCFPHSEKGSRSLTRAPRRRAWGTRWLFAPKVWVLLARASDGRVASAVNGDRRPPLERDYLAFLAPRVAGGELAVGPGLSALARRLVQRPELAERRLTVRTALPEHRRALRYVEQLRSWLRRFRGVATRYLPNYLAWHRFLEVCEHLPGVSGEGHLLQAAFP